MDFFKFKGEKKKLLVKFKNQNSILPLLLFFYVSYFGERKKILSTHLLAWELGVPLFAFNVM